MTGPLGGRFVSNLSMQVALYTLINTIYRVKYAKLFLTYD